MPKIAKISIALSVIFSLLLMGAYLLPSKFEIVVSEEVNVERSAIFPYLNDLRQWEDWSPWSRFSDPEIDITYPKTSIGEGASCNYKGPTIGDGKIELVESYPERGIAFRFLINNQQLSINSNIQFETFSDKPDFTRLVWTANGKWGNNPIFRYFGWFFDDALKTELELSIFRLKALVEG